MSDYINQYRGTIFNLILFGSYFLLKPFFAEQTTMPTWLAVLFLIVIFTEIGAVFYKLQAIHFRASKTKPPKLMQSWIFIGLAIAIRLTIFTLIADIALTSLINAETADQLTNWLIGFFVIKEFCVLALFKLAPNFTNRKKKTSFLLETLADINLILMIQVAYFSLHALFISPLIDMSDNLITIIIVSFLAAFLFLLFYIPFRIVYLYEEWQQGNFRLAHGLSLLLVLITFLSPLTYDTKTLKADFKHLLQNRPNPTEFIYTETNRLDPEVTELLCQYPELTRLTLSTKHTNYLAPCVFELPNLQHLDLSNNKITNLQ